MVHRGVVAQVGLDELDLLVEVLHVVHAAAPAEGAEDLHVRVLREQIFRQEQDLN